MNVDAIGALALLVVALVFFIWGRWRYDLVALGALVVAVALGLVPAENAFDGFAHPAVVTVAAVLVLSRGLRNAGLTILAGRVLDRLSVTPTLHVASLTVTVAVISSFMNNVAALSLMLPVAIATAERRGRSPGILLMPIAFGSLLGGLTTMIGTPPNLIVAAYRADLTGERFELFDFTPVGLGVALAGVAFVALFGWRLVPVRERARTLPQRGFAVDDYVTEVRVTGERAPVGVSYSALCAAAPSGVEVVGVTRGDAPIRVPASDLALEHADVLLVHGEPEALQEFIRTNDLALSGRTAPGSGRGSLAEAIVTSGSPFVGRRLRAIRAAIGDAARVIGVASPRAVEHRRLRDVRLEVGDVLLVEGDSTALHGVLASIGLLPLADRVLPLGTRARPAFALIAFFAAIAASALGWLPLPVALTGVVVVYAATGVIRPGELYRSIEWPVVILLGAFIPVGEALHDAGATDIVANAILAVAGSLPLPFVIALLLIATMLLTDVLNNATTALVMAPIAASVAEALGLSVDPFLMTVAIGSSCAFLTPVGHQSNTLVMAPGGYRFGDYWRMGLPLQLVVVTAAVPLVLWVWPPGG